MASASPATTDIDVLNVFLQHNQWPGSYKQMQAIMSKYKTVDALSAWAKGLSMHKGLVHTPAWVMKALAPELGNKVAYLGVDTGIAKIFIRSAAEGWDAGKTEAALETNKWWQSHNDAQKKWIISGTGDRNVLRQQAAQSMSDAYQHLYGAYKDPNEFLKQADGLASGQLSIDQWTQAQMRTPDFQARYAGNYARQRAGLSMLTPEQYRQTEEAYKDQLRQSGVDVSQLTPQDYVEMFRRDMQPGELGQRLDVWRTYSQMLLPEDRKVFQDKLGINPSDQDIYGMISGTRPDLAATYSTATGKPLSNLSITGLQQALKQAQQEHMAQFNTGGVDTQIEKQVQPEVATF